MLVTPFANPAISCILAGTAGGGLSVFVLLGAVGSAAIGVITERWLFIAEAEHVVNTYHGRGQA